MRKLIESTFVSLDGTISDPQEWCAPYWDEQHADHARKLLWDADALLLGRETYEAFAEAWPSREGDEYADRINAMTKYVASRTLTEATWNATIIKGDVADAVTRLKDQDGGNILKFGTGVLDHTLLEHKLVDEYHFWMFPVIAGTGGRLFDGVDTTHLHLTGVERFDSGITLLTYAPR